MQKINYKEKIYVENKINDLLLINIDDTLEKTRESDFTKVNGQIKISGEVITEIGKENFFHSIDIDILLGNEQIISEDITISIDDFNYTIENNSIIFDLIVKLEGLKEIDAYFPTQEDTKYIEKTIDEESIIDIENIEEGAFENYYDPINNTIEIDSINDNFEPSKELSKRNSNINIDNIDLKKNKIIEVDSQAKENIISKNIQNKSLYNQLFKNKKSQNEITYMFHVIKDETTYTQIANLYNIEENKIKKANGEENFYNGKLIFIPKE